MMNTYNIRSPLSASMKRIRGRERGRETARLTARRSHLVERNIVMKFCVTLPSSTTEFLKSLSAPPKFCRALTKITSIILDIYLITIG